MQRPRIDRRFFYENGVPRSASITEARRDPPAFQWWRNVGRGWQAHSDGSPQGAFRAIFGRIRIRLYGLGSVWREF